MLDSGRMVSFTKSFVYLGSLLHCDLSDGHDADARIKKTIYRTTSLEPAVSHRRVYPDIPRGKSGTALGGIRDTRAEELSLQEAGALVFAGAAASLAARK